MLYSGLISRVVHLKILLLCYGSLSLIKNLKKKATRILKVHLLIREILLSKKHQANSIQKMVRRKKGKRNGLSYTRDSIMKPKSIEKQH